MGALTIRYIKMEESGNQGRHGNQLWKQGFVEAAAQNLGQERANALTSTGKYPNVLASFAQIPFTVWSSGMLRSAWPSTLGAMEKSATARKDRQASGTTHAPHLSHSTTYDPGPLKTLLAIGMHEQRPTLIAPLYT